MAWQTEQNLKCSGCTQPRDEAWVFDPDDQRELTAKFKSQVGPRLCAACLAVAKDRKRHRESGGDDSGLHWTFEEPD